MSTDLDIGYDDDRFDKHSSFKSFESKINGFSSEVSGPDKDIFTITLMILCIIGMILALVFIIFGKKFKKYKSTTTETITTTNAIELKDMSSNREYQPVSNV
ncbi:unnamed protein product [Rotaria sp. Silwood1]|nr:unnamed protein product [Rotaria sp. Silwood1]CAF3495951.1 unnamed protein product [Rotaria sp. Silwood1]CAF3548749.1 unnamed protein product [Rotaria sp. Silwood1]CAF4810508.1 unnamed protein product [Rotaria sp. Silwood1]CAF4857186.1 unnamed protein product [Rotaria sp. Silwood1]